jgi:hypothetical protein
MAALTIDDFTPHVGTTYEVDLDGAAVTLTLEEARPLPQSVREAGSFALLFRGPPEPMLPQAIHTLRSAGRSDEIFITPVARDQSGTEYEAVFN